LNVLGKTTTDFYLRACKHYEQMFLEMERQAKQKQEGKKKDFKRAARSR
jgi:hypothetical protein